MNGIGKTYGGDFTSDHQVFRVFALEHEVGGTKQSASVLSTHDFVIDREIFNEIETLFQVLEI